MSTSTILHILQTAQFTRSLKPKYLEKLAEMAIEVTYHEGEILYQEGDADDVLYLIDQGQVAVETHIPGKEWVTLRTVGSGQLLDWSAFFPHQHTTTSSRATTNVHAVAISTPQLRDACQNDQEFGYEITLCLAELIANNREPSSHI